MSIGRHRWTKAGLKQDNDHLQKLLRAEQTKAAHQHQTASREIARLQDALQAWEARWANAHPIHVPAPRDLRANDDRPTVPTDVSSVRAIFPVTPIYPITERAAAADAANPAHIPAA